MNRIQKMLREVSDKLHEMEKSGTDFTEAEDELRSRLTAMLESGGWWLDKPDIGDS